MERNLDRPTSMQIYCCNKSIPNEQAPAATALLTVCRASCLASSNMYLQLPRDAVGQILIDDVQRVNDNVAVLLGQP
jgi:hypothetical protein